MMNRSLLRDKLDLIILFIIKDGNRRTFIFLFEKGTLLTNTSYIGGTKEFQQTVSSESNITLQKSLQHTNDPSAHGGAASAKINFKNAGVKDSVSTRVGARKDGGTRGTKRGREDVRYFFSFCFTPLSG